MSDNPPILRYGLRNRLRAVLHFYPFVCQESSLIIWAYIDGFNLYNGALKGTPYKWLDLHEFTSKLRPTDTISQVKFFSAKVNSRPNDPDQPIRQMLYWRALRTITTVEIVEGHFLTKPTYLPEVTSMDQITARQKSGENTRGIFPKMAHVYRSEEKGTDVNLAVQLVHDAPRNRFTILIIGYMPEKRFFREELIRLPGRFEDWRY